MGYNSRDRYPRERSPVKDLYFVRHGQTEWNAIRRMQGQWNSDLNDTGRAQAHAHGRFLAELGIEHIVVSPLERTRQTAGIINEYLGLELHFDERIMEWDCGDWSGEMWDEVGQKWPEEFAAWRADPFGYRGPNAENYPDMIDRARPFLKGLAGMPHERIAIVSHGMIGKIMVSDLLGHSPAEMLGFSQPNDLIYNLSQSGSGYTVRHFIGGEGPFPGLAPGSR